MGSPEGSRKDEVRDYWNVHVQTWKVSTHAPGTAEFFREIEDYRFEKLHYLPRRVNYAGYAGQRVLDIGCGLANDTSRFAKGGALVTGVDLSPRAIELSRLNFQQRGLQGDFAVMDGEQLDFPDASFDVVYCHTVLHFTPDPGRMIDEAWRVLKPGGTAILMTVNCRSWMNVMRHVMKVEIDHLDSPVYHRIDYPRFRRMLDRFAQVTLVSERFPVATRVHSGLKARLFNGVFVGGFNSLPRRFTERSGHHLLGLCRK